MEVLTEQTLSQQNINQNVQMPQVQVQQKTVQMLCCICGISFNPGITKTNICVKCLSAQTNIKDGITQEGVINFCRQCKRYQRPPWTYCERESREMLSLCLKKIKGLNKVKLVDACFVWTEEHSKRIKVKLTIQKEILNNINIQETFVVEFIEHYTQCEDCKKEYTPHTWGALVQVRQRVEHKKTFFYLEQLILKHNVHEKCLKIKEEPEGLDFYYKNKTQAQRLIDFLQSMFPTKVKTSKQLISTDIHSNLYNYKYTFYIELPKICRDDLIIIPNKLRSQLGGCNQLLICSKVSNAIHFIDAITYRVVEMNSNQYYLYESDMVFIPLKGNETEFMINNVEHDLSQKKNLNLSIVSNATSLLAKVVDVEVSRTTDWKTFSVKSHLGDILKCGTSVIGYDLSVLNLSDADINISNLADVILVKKMPQTKAEKKRIWKLKRMNIEEMEEGQKKKKDKKKNNDDAKKNQEFEEFLEDVEAHPDMRQNMNLFRDENNIKDMKEQKKQKHEKRDQKNANKRKVKVKINQEQKQLEEEKLGETKKQEKQQEQVDSDWEDVDDDDDNVKLAELLKDLNLNEKEEPQVDDEQFFNDFVQKMNDIKIENKPSINSANNNIMQEKK